MQVQNHYTSAEYTMYLRDYLLAGNVLPASITSRTEHKLGGKTLEQLFIQKYNLREIGYENEQLFFDMLDITALTNVGYYFDRISNVEALKNKLFISENEQEAKNFIKPLGTDTLALDDVNVESASKLKVSNTPAGKSNIDLIADYDEKIKNYWNDLLNVFERNFIQLR